MPLKTHKCFPKSVEHWREIWRPHSLMEHSFLRCVINVHDLPGGGGPRADICAMPVSNNQSERHVAQNEARNITLCGLQIARLKLLCGHVVVVGSNRLAHNNNVLSSQATISSMIVLAGLFSHVCGRNDRMCCWSEK